MKNRLIPALALLTLAGCASSPPTRYFALDPATARAPPPASTTAGAPVKVDAVHIPPALDRDSMVRGESDNQLQISSQDRWAGDLGEMIRRVLTQDLAQRLPSGMVIAPRVARAAELPAVWCVDILTFQPQAGEVVLDADWTLLQGTQSNPVLRRSVHLTRLRPILGAGPGRGHERPPRPAGRRDRGAALRCAGSGHPARPSAVASSSAVFAHERCHLRRGAFPILIE